MPKLIWDACLKTVRPKSSMLKKEFQAIYTAHSVTDIILDIESNET